MQVPVVLVERADGARLRFVVGARSFSKAGFPTAAVFGPAATSLTTWWCSPACRLGRSGSNRG